MPRSTDRLFADAKEAVADWNARYPIGTPVHAYPGVRQGAGLVTRTRSKAWNVGGSPVVLVEGYAGGIALTHVDILEGVGRWQMVVTDAGQHLRLVGGNGEIVLTQEVVEDPRTVLEALELVRRTPNVTVETVDERTRQEPPPEPTGAPESPEPDQGGGNTP